MSRRCISSAIPRHHKILRLIAFLFLLLKPSVSQPHNTMLHVGRRQNSCHPISSHLPPPIRLHLQQLRRCPPFPPPPPGVGNEIDPRYGVEKRLVPSGPNPLHNWSPILITSIPFLSAIFLLYFWFFLHFWGAIFFLNLIRGTLAWRKSWFSVCDCFQNQDWSQTFRVSASVAVYKDTALLLRWYLFFSCFFASLFAAKMAISKLVLDSHSPRRIQQNPSVGGAAQRGSSENNRENSLLI